jgi:hypothetical protein
MQISAMQLQIRDVLTDGTVVASVSRSQGHTYAKMEDGRQLICADHFILCIDRPPVAPDNAMDGDKYEGAVLG